MLLRGVVASVVVVWGAAIVAAGAVPAGKPVAKTAEKPKAVVKAAPSESVLPEEAIRRALDQRTKMEFVQVPLADVAAYIAELHRIPVVFDKKALDDVGVEAKKTPVGFTADGLKLRSALRHILRQLDLTWTIEDEALVITTPEQADARLETRVYEVGDLVAARDEQLRPYNDFDQIIEMITSTVKPTSWDAVGGPGSIAAFEAAGITALVVSQTQEVQGEIDRVLGELRKVKKGSAEPPIRAQQPKAGASNGMGGSPAVGVDGMGESSSAAPAKPQAGPERKPAARSRGEKI